MPGLPEGLASSSATSSTAAGRSARAEPSGALGSDCATAGRSNGIGEQRGVPAFAHAGRRFGQTFALDVYAGALLGGLLRVEDSGGGKLAEQDVDPAPFLGGTFSTRF